MLVQIANALALASLASAHFQLLWPTSAGFVEDDEPTMPCGGQTVTVNSSSTQIQVDRFAAEILFTHPTGGFTILASTNTAAPYTFTQVAALTADGPGTFCANYLSVPSSFAGKAGVIQVIDQSPDGTLYQCAPVNFVSGSNSTLGDHCTNSSSISLTWSGSGSSTNSNATSSTGSVSGGATAAMTSSMSSHTNGAAMATLAPIFGGLGALAAGFML